MQGLHLSRPQSMKSGGGPFKHGNKPSGFMKGAEFEKRQFYQLIKNVTAVLRLLDARLI